MRIETKRCSFCRRTKTWVLQPLMIEVKSPAEFKAAWKEFIAENQRFQDLSKIAGGSNEQE